MIKTVKTHQETTYKLTEQDLVRMITSKDELPENYFVRVERREIRAGVFEACVELVIRQNVNAEIEPPKTVQCRCYVAPLPAEVIPAAVPADNKCNDCDGTGREPGTHSRGVCETCHGLGFTE